MGSAVVTGAASGIGLALARVLAEEGRHVYLADVVDTTSAAARLGGTPVVADVTDPDQMVRLAAVATDADLVCLNAGVLGATMGPPWEAGPDEWRRVLEVNLLGVVNGLRAFVPPLLRRGDPAHVLVTASLAGLLAFPGGGAYGASKHALVAVAEQTALALADSNVGVTVLCPALVRSAMSPTGDDPHEVAVAALDAVRDGQFVVTPPQWRAAIAERGTRLAAGRQPAEPRPAPPSSAPDPGTDGER